MQYQVTKQFTRGPETLLQTFKNYAEAEAFVQTQLTEDIRYNVQAIYRIHEFGDILKEFTQADAINTDVGSASQSGKKQSFAPTPFNTKPQPGGLPHSWIKDEPDEDEKK